MSVTRTSTLLPLAESDGSWTRALGGGIVAVSQTGRCRAADGSEGCGRCACVGLLGCLWLGCFGFGCFGCDAAFAGRSGVGGGGRQERDQARRCGDQGSRQGNRGARVNARAAIHESEVDLRSALDLLAANGLRSSLAAETINHAGVKDETALRFGGSAKGEAAYVESALQLKRRALAELPQLSAPTPTPTPTGTALEDCSFNPAVGQLEVKVSWQGEVGATVHVAVGPSSNQLTTTLNASGLGTPDRSPSRLELRTRSSSKRPTRPPAKRLRRRRPAFRDRAPRPTAKSASRSRRAPADVLRTLPTRSS